MGRSNVPVGHYLQKKKTKSTNNIETHHGSLGSHKSRVRSRKLYAKGRSSQIQNCKIMNFKWKQKAVKVSFVVFSQILKSVECG